MTATNTPTSSKLAMLRNGSPLRYAQGADFRSRLNENQRASEVGLPP